MFWLSIFLCHALHELLSLLLFFFFLVTRLVALKQVAL